MCGNADSDRYRKLTEEVRRVEREREQRERQNPRPRHHPSRTGIDVTKEFEKVKKKESVPA